MSKAAHLHPKQGKSVVFIKLEFQPIFAGKLVEDIPVDAAQIRGRQNVLGVLNPGRGGVAFGSSQLKEKQVVIHHSFSGTLGSMVDEHEVVLLQCPAQNLLLLWVIQLVNRHL